MEKNKVTSKTLPTGVIQSNIAKKKKIEYKVNMEEVKELATAKLSELDLMRMIIEEHNELKEIVEQNSAIDTSDNEIDTTDETEENNNLNVEVEKGKKISRRELAKSLHANLPNRLKESNDVHSEPTQSSKSVRFPSTIEGNTSEGTSKLISGSKKEDGKNFITSFENSIIGSFSIDSMVKIISQVKGEKSGPLLQIMEKDQKIVQKRDSYWEEVLELWNYRQNTISSKLESCNSLKMLDQIEKLLQQIDKFVSRLKEIILNPKGDLSKLYQEISMRERSQTSDSLPVYFALPENSQVSFNKHSRRSATLASMTKKSSRKLNTQPEVQTSKNFRQLLVCVLSIIEALKAVYPIQDLLETKNFSQNWSQNKEVNDTIKALQTLKECVNKEIQSIDATVERANTIFVSIEKISNLVSRSHSVFDDYVASLESNTDDDVNNNDNNDNNSENNDTPKEEKPENIILKVSRSLQSCAQFLSASIDLTSEFPSLDGNPIDSLTWGNPNTKNELKSAKIDKLIDYLIAPISGDVEVVKVLDVEEIFLQTFDYYISTRDLLEKLFVRYCLSPTFFIPPKIEIAELPDQDNTKTNHQIPQRIRVLAFIRKWIGQHYKRDFHESPITETLIQFLTNTASLTGNFFEAKTIISELSKNQKIYSVISTPQVAPPKTLGMSWDNYSFLELSPRDVAIQLSLFEYDILRKMKIEEFFHQSWAKKDKEIKSPTIVKFTRHFNRVSSWIIRSVLIESDVEKRAQVIRRLLAIAMHLLQLNNFNGILEILSGLRNSTIDRLKLTWNYVGPQMNEVKIRLATLMLSKMQLYRYAWDRTDGPALPYIGLTLTDLTFLEDGNPTFLSDGNVNFFKFRKMSESIRNLLKHQDSAYSYDRNQMYFDIFENLEDFDIVNEDAWSHRSNEVEPKAMLENVERYTSNIEEEDLNTQYANLMLLKNHPLVQEVINPPENNNQTTKAIPVSDSNTNIVQSEAEVSPSVSTENLTIPTRTFDLFEIEDLVGRMRATLPTKERRYRLKTLASTFYATDAVNWVVENVGLTRKDAIALCQQFLTNNHIQHALKENKRVFRDKPSVYRFVDKIQFLKERSDSNPNMFLKESFKDLKKAKRTATLQ